MTVQVEIRGSIEVDDIAAELLNHMSSFGAAGDVVQHFAGKYSVQQVRLALNKIHCETAEVLKARRRALAAAEISS